MKPQVTNVDRVKTGTIIIKCGRNCNNMFQDQQYGAGNRLHNLAPKANGARCTVCGNVHRF